jgi:16S rRNA G1207 methylase RsmC
MIQVSDEVVSFEAVSSNPPFQREKGAERAVFQWSKLSAINIHLKNGRNSKKLGEK